MDWSWRLAANALNAIDDAAVNENMFANDESSPREVRELNPFYRTGCTVNATKLKMNSAIFIRFK